MSTEADLNRFYALLTMLEQGLGGAPKLGDCHGKMAWPERGVYFFLNPVRHALTASHLGWYALAHMP